MSEISAILANLRELMELDQAAGVSFVPRPEATSSASLPIVPLRGSPRERLGALEEGIAACRRCQLCEGRRHSVAGEGDPSAALLFVGEGPGADEDATGRPFVGAAGRLLDKMIMAMGLERGQVFIANVVKCRPPQNRAPEADEAAACMPWLEQQVDVIGPKVICTLGRTPYQALSGSEQGIIRARGVAFQWRDIPVVPTFHPAYLLQNPSAKKEAWQDLQQVLGLLSLPLPGR